MADDELLRLYSDWFDESTRLLVLKLPRCKADRADPILLGLGRALSFPSDLAAPIFTGRENSFDLAFSDLDGGLSGTDEGIGGGSGNGGCGDDPASLGELCPDLGKTTLAAVAAADGFPPRADECPPSLSMFKPPVFEVGDAESRGVLDSVKLRVGGLSGALLPLVRLLLSLASACKGTV